MSKIKAALLAVFIAGFAILMPASAASAAPPLCTAGEFVNPANFQRCVAVMHDLSQDQIACVQAPTPATPDSGMAGWFAGKPTAYDQSGIKGLFTRYGYAGYDFTTYDIGCVQTTMHPDYKFENTIANGEFMVSSSLLGMSDAIREHAWDPKTMYGWADPLITNITHALYARVFTALGAVTLAIVGLYLLWRARQAEMSHAVTTAAWAVIVMVVVTAVAQWPVTSANLADRALTGSLGTIHKALSSVQPTAIACRNLDQSACTDRRAPAVAVSDTVTYGLEYRNWLRGELGSADSPTAQKYGPALYDAKTMTWGEASDAAKDPAQRKTIIAEKQRRWEKIALQIKTDDPLAYEYLQGSRGWDRIGAGLISIIAAMSFLIFDLAASIMVLIGFLIFRWAVIALPLLGTIGLFRPASGGIRRIRDAVIGSAINIIIFGTGAAIYAFFVDAILSTRALAGWLQVFLIFLTGAVGWFVLRPYRRLRHIGGHDPIRIVSRTAVVASNVERSAARKAKTAMRS